MTARYICTRSCSTSGVSCRGSTSVSHGSPASLGSGTSTASRSDPPAAAAAASAASAAPAGPSRKHRPSTIPAATSSMQAGRQPGRGRPQRRLPRSGAAPLRLAQHRRAPRVQPARPVHGILSGGGEPHLAGGDHQPSLPRPLRPVARRRHDAFARRRAGRGRLAADRRRQLLHSRLIDGRVVHAP